MSEIVSVYLSVQIFLTQLVHLQSEEVGMLRMQGPLTELEQRASPQALRSLQRPLRSYQMKETCFRQEKPLHVIF